MTAVDPSGGSRARDDAFELATRLFLLYLVLNPGIGWRERVPVIVLAGLGWVLPGLARAPGLWAALAVATAFRVIWNWPLADNHDYLTSLWCVAFFAALHAPDAAPALARSGRLLLGLTFAFASLWKLALSPDFLDGTFFRVTLLTDPRFADLAVLLGGMSWESFDANDAARAAYQSGVPWSESGFVEPPELRQLAGALTVFTAVIETALGLAFLWPAGRGPSRVRDILLVVFCVTTFSVARVAGFGGLLVAMAIAQCPPSWRMRGAYLASFFLIFAYRAVPWSEWLVEVLR